MKPQHIEPVWLVTYEPPNDREWGRREFDSYDAALDFCDSKPFDTTVKLWFRPGYTIPPMTLLSRRIPNQA